MNPRNSGRRNTIPLLMAASGIDYGKTTLTERILATLEPLKNNMENPGTTQTPEKTLQAEKPRRITLAKTTFALLKPDAFETDKAAEIIRRLQNNGFLILRMLHIESPEEHQVCEHLRELLVKNPEAYHRNVASLMKGPVTALRIGHKDDENIVEKLRNYVGATDPSKASRGTLRSISPDSIAQAETENRAVRNLIHAADTAENAAYEEEIWFKNETRKTKWPETLSVEQNFPEKTTPPVPPPVYQIFETLGHDTYEYECPCACIPNGCMGHGTNIPISISFQNATFMVAGYDAGDFPNKEESDYICDIVERIETAGRIFQPALELIRDMLVDQETLSAEIRNEALCERARKILTEAEFPI